MSLGLPLGLATASGLNTYIPLFALALLARYGNVVTVSPKFQWLVSDPTVVVLAVLALCEVLADKFPGMDHVWDSIHTLLRPVAGALAAGATVSTDNLFETALVMAMGGSLATVSHAAKASVRLVSTSESLGFANPILSIVEDVTSFVATLFAVFAPWLMAIIVALFVAASVLAAPPILRTLRYKMGALGGATRWAFRKMARTPPPRDLQESCLEIAPRKLTRLRDSLEKNEQLLGTLQGWRRSGWGPRRICLLITSQKLVLAERRFPNRLKTQPLAYSDLQLVREHSLLLISRLELFTRQNRDVVLLLPKTQREFAKLAVLEISERSGLTQGLSANPQRKLVPATP